MGAQNSKGQEVEPSITPDFTFSSGFITGILISILFLVISWFAATSNENASKFYQGMMCAFIE
jgi:hypothetical protein